MEGINQFIKQKKEMIQMEKNNLEFFESAQAQHTLEHAKEKASKTQMVDDSTSVEDDENDEAKQERIQFLEKNLKDALSNDSHKGKRHFAEQYELDPHSNEFSDQSKHKQDLTDSRHQEYQVYLAESVRKESKEFRRKIDAKVQYHHDQELHQHQHQRDVNQANNRQHVHELDVKRQHGHELLDIERDIRSIEAQDAAVTTSHRYHQESNENPRHHKFSGTKFNPDADADHKAEQAQETARTKIEHQRKKKIDDKNQELEGLRERDRCEGKNMTIAHDQCNQNKQFYPLRQHAHDAPRFTEGAP